MKTIHRAIFITLLLLLNACAAALQPENYVERIETTRLDYNRFQVDYRGDAAQAATAGVDLALLRSAEVALRNGYHYFIVIDPADPVTAGSNPLQQSVSNSTVYGGQRYRLADPGPSNTILCFKQKPEGFAYIALFVKASLRSKYGLDQPGEPI